MIKFTITPEDVLFFGDAKPFNRGNDGASVFPPLPNTFASSIFAKLYYHKDIKYDGRKQLIKNVYGPFLQKDGELYFQAPKDIFVNEKEPKSWESKNDVSVLRPMSGKENLFLKRCKTDMEDLSCFMWLGEEIDKDKKSFDGFISLKGLNKWYEGRFSDIKPEDLLKKKSVYKTEVRTGIKINDESGTTESEDGLFKVSFVRLCMGFEFAFWVDFDLENLKGYFRDEKEILKFFDEKPRILKIGGEAKTALYRCEIDDFTLKFKDFKKESGEDKKFFKHVFLTPLIFDESNKNILKLIEGFKGGVTGKYIIAGINSKSIGTKTVRAMPAGSVIYTDKNRAQLLTFENQSSDFIGSNLMLSNAI
ncbi:MAG TPA: type III-B CRISPR module-associated protein Cmr3 [Spirochaetota bacterium]|nr:type III-B CRISPR module-associated protein Cmr3 [Spirochaetota bacterium]HPP96355.1 type III-B CRISPR module-associated protein Cmr3 [Spirochaetota bacterium]